MGIPYVRVNTEDYPFGGIIDYQPTDSSKPLFKNLTGADTVRSIWYRRIRVPPCPPAMDAGLYDFCVRENRSALIGGLLSHSTRWMSHPDAIWRAEYKPFQLRRAAELGFETPRTLISNVPESIRDFFEVCGEEMIAKPVRSGHMVQAGIEYAAYTTQLKAKDLDSLEDAANSPTIYQELLPKRFDIRVTVVGDKLFAAAIDSQTDPNASVDWRRTTNPFLPHKRIDLPPALESQIFRFMETLSLRYGALDFVLTPDDRYVFLEINPNGQWLWLDDMLGLGIASEIAQWLAIEEE